MLVLHNVRMESSNVRKKKKGTIKCDKSTVQCDIGTVELDNRTIKCEEKNKGTTKKGFKKTNCRRQVFLCYEEIIVDITI